MQQQTSEFPPSIRKWHWKGRNKVAEDAERLLRFVSVRHLISFGKTDGSDGTDSGSVFVGNPWGCWAFSCAADSSAKRIFSGATQWLLSINLSLKPPRPLLSHRVFPPRLQPAVNAPPSLTTGDRMNVPYWPSHAPPTVISCSTYLQSAHSLGSQHVK